VLGLLPIGLGLGEGAQPAAGHGPLSVMGGLFIATFLTMIVVPSIYNLLDIQTERLVARTRKAVHGDE